MGMLFDKTPLARNQYGYEIPPARHTDPPASHKARVDLTGKCKLFVEALAVSSEPLTAQEVAARCGGHSANQESIRKRAKELLDDGKIKKCGERRCSVTGRMAMTYRVVR